MARGGRVTGISPPRRGGDSASAGGRAPRAGHSEPAPLRERVLQDGPHPGREYVAVPHGPGGQVPAGAGDDAAGGRLPGQRRLEPAGDGGLPRRQLRVRHVRQGVPHRGRRHLGHGTVVPAVRLRVLRRIAHEAARRRQQPARLRGGPEHVPAHEEARLLGFR